MKPRTLYNLSGHPFLTWSELAFKTGEMMLASAQVIGYRVNRMALAGPIPNARDQREFSLMSGEKIAAAAESAQAMALSMIRLNQQLGVLAFKQFLTGAAAMVSIVSSRAPAQSAAQQARLARNTIANSAQATPQISTSVARLVKEGLKPVHARVRRNAKRLRKR
jgi:hypothetical protein